MIYHSLKSSFCLHYGGKGRKNSYPHLKKEEIRHPHRPANNKKKKKKLSPPFSLAPSKGVLPLCAQAHKEMVTLESQCVYVHTDSPIQHCPLDMSLWEKITLGDHLTKESCIEEGRSERRAWKLTMGSTITK